MHAPEARTPDRRRSRLQLVLIFALFLAPPVAAWFAWQYVGDHGVGATTNAGTLIQPPRPLRVSGLARPDGDALTDADLRGRWTYVLFAPAGCDDRCRRQLYLTRQIRLAMNKDMPRVRRILVLDDQPGPDLARRLAAEHTDLELAIRRGEAARLIETFSGGGFAPSGAQYFLVDPLGNLMMFYDLEIPAKGTMKDLRKLLKISQIG
jgi:hypothetical protein